MPTGLRVRCERERTSQQTLRTEALLGPASVGAPKAGNPACAATTGQAARREPAIYPAAQRGFAKLQSLALPPECSGCHFIGNE